MESENSIARLAVLQLLAEVLAHLSDVRHASDDRAKCAVRVSRLHDFFPEVDLRLEEGSPDTPSFATVRVSAVEKPPLDKTKQALETLKIDMTQRGLEKLGPAFLWKIGQDDVATILYRVEQSRALEEWRLDRS
jgi:hypothetical protein